MATNLISSDIFFVIFAQGDLAAGLWHNYIRVRGHRGGPATGEPDEEPQEHDRLVRGAQHKPGHSHSALHVHGLRRVLEIWRARRISRVHLLGPPRNGMARAFCLSVGSVLILHHLFLIVPIIAFFVRTAKAVMILISIGVFFTYPLIFYVPIELILPPLQVYFPGKYDTIVELVLRYALVLLTCKKEPLLHT